MRLYNIGAVARLTGLSVHNLRVWEKRHNAIHTVRTEGGRRQYDDTAIERLLMLKGCTDRGATISHIAALSNEELRSTLTALTEGSDADRRSPTGRLCVVGSYANQLLNADSLRTESPLSIERYVSLQQVRTLYSGNRADALVVDEQSMTDLSSQRLIEVAQQTSAGVVHIIYRYARLKDLQRLRAHGYHTWNAPVDRDALLQALLKPLRQTVSQVHLATTAQDQIAPRQFNDDTLARLAALKSRVECECPRHLSELVIALSAFETYSNQCENQNTDDAALHLSIYRDTAKARAIMETLLANVLRHEGIDPPQGVPTSPSEGETYVL